MRFLKIGDQVVNLAMILDVELNCRAANPTKKDGLNRPPLESAARINLACSVGGDDDEWGMSTVCLELFDAEAEAVREFFAPGPPTTRRLGATIDITPEVPVSEDPPLVIDATCPICQGSLLVDTHDAVGRSSRVPCPGCASRVATDEQTLAHAFEPSYRDGE